MVDNNDLRLRFYPGVGPSLEIHETDNDDDDDDENAVRLAVRAPLGLAFEIKYFARHNAPIDLFVEVAPGLRLYDRTGFAIDGGIGARYYF